MEGEVVKTIFRRGDIVIARERRGVEKNGRRNGRLGHDGIYWRKQFGVTLSRSFPLRKQGRTDGRTDGQTDRQTDNGLIKEPAASCWLPFCCLESTGVGLLLYITPTDDDDPTARPLCAQLNWP